jgi:hypothetical protein
MLFKEIIVVYCENHMKLWANGGLAVKSFLKGFRVTEE